MSKRIENEIDGAMFRSITKNKTVHLTHTDMRKVVLMARCDGCIDTAGGVEFWGVAQSDDPGALGKREWRIHLDREVAS